MLSNNTQSTHELLLSEEKHQNVRKNLQMLQMLKTKMDQIIELMHKSSGVAKANFHFQLYHTVEDVFLRCWKILFPNGWININEHRRLVSDFVEKNGLFVDKSGFIIPKTLRNGFKDTQEKHFLIFKTRNHKRKLLSDETKNQPRPHTGILFFITDII